MKLEESTYYSSEANKEYMSVSQYKDFVGTPGHAGCEFCAMKKMNGTWSEGMNNAMMIGSYVDHYYEGTLEPFKAEHPEIFKKDGTLKAEFMKAESVINRINKDEYFLKYLAGDKQVIMTADLFGTPWKIKMDSYFPGVCIVDLKVMQSIREMYYSRQFGYMDFIRYWGYDIQGAIYQAVVEKNTGKKLPFYIAAASKEYEPDIQVIQITQNYLDDALESVKANLERVIDVKKGKVMPCKCGACACCRHYKKLSHVIGIQDIINKQ